MWVKVEHKGEIFGEHYNVSEWLAAQLNELNATQVHIIEHDRSNGIFEAVALVPDNDEPA